MSSKLAMTMASVAQIQQAAQHLLQGELVALPTETVYGLGADASNPEAIAKIYAAKGRPSNHPVIVHVSGPEQASRWVKELPVAARQLMAAFWPGPLTLILKRADWVDASVSGGQDTIGIRCPSHPVAQALLHAFDDLQPGKPSGVAAPSANRFGRVSPTTSTHVREEFAELVAQGMPVLEGESSEIGIESTIVDLSRLAQGHPPALLRPGHIGAADIESVLGVQLVGHDADAPRVSGALKAHYAPRTPMQLVAAADLVSVAKAWCQSHPGKRLAVACYSETGKAGHDSVGERENEHKNARTQQTDGRPEKALMDSIVWCQMPSNPVSYAQALYAQLRAVDTLQVETVLWEAVPETQLWDGVRDRLERAAAAFVN